MPLPLRLPLPLSVPVPVPLRWCHWSHGVCVCVCVLVPTALGNVRLPRSRLLRTRAQKTKEIYIFSASHLINIFLDSIFSFVFFSVRFLLVICSCSIYSDACSRCIFHLPLAALRSHPSVQQHDICVNFSGSCSLHLINWIQSFAFGSRIKLKQQRLHWAQHRARQNEMRKYVRNSIFNHPCIVTVFRLEKSAEYRLSSVDCGRAKATWKVERWRRATRHDAKRGLNGIICSADNNLLHSWLWQCQARHCVPLTERNKQCSCVARL